MIEVRRYQKDGQCPIARKITYEEWKAEVGWHEEDWGSDAFVWTRTVEIDGETFIEVIWDDPEASANTATP